MMDRVRTLVSSEFHQGMTRSETGISVLVSDLGLMWMMYLLYLFGHAYGWKALISYYFIPYVVSATSFSKH